MPRGNKQSLATYLQPGSSRPSTKAQRRWQEWLSGPVTAVSSDGAGAISTVISPSLSQLAKYTSYSGTWDEYRFIAIRFEVLPLGINPGSTVFFVDDEDTTAPSVSTAEAKGEFVMAANNAAYKTPFVIPYRSENLTDLEFLSVSTQSTNNFGVLKLYGDTANYNVTASTKYWLVRWEALIEFRGPGGH